MNLNEYLEKGLVHSIHTSERRSFRGCRRRWNWVYREFYYPKVEAPALEFGVAFHKAMEVFYSPTLWGKPDHQLVAQGLALSAFKEECEKQFRKYKRLNGDPEKNVIDDYHNRIELGLNMIRHYTNHVSPLYDQGFTPVEVEVPFEVLVQSPQGEALWCKCDRCWKKYYAWIKQTNAYDLDAEWFTINGTKTLRELLENGRHWLVDWQGLPVTYGGRLDLLAQDKDGRYWIVDWKTTSRILDEDAEASFLQLDDQISSYCFALRTLGIPVAGFIYVEIKKSYPKPPEELSRPYKGRKFSTNKQHLTTYSLFKAHVMAHDPEAFLDGAYEDYLNWLQIDGPKFHQRHQIHKNDHELDEIGHNIWLEAQDIIGNPLVYPQPGRFSCGTCLFRQPCLGKNMGEHWEYTLETLFEKRNKHYYEEQLPSTE